MKQNQILGTVFIKLVLVACLAISKSAPAQDTMVKYSTMAPVEEYLMDRQAEIDLARTSAPESISLDAEVLILGRHGYETAVKGKNGFVCIVGRGWSSAADPDFWNPKVRVPMCVNAPAARSYLMAIRKITDLALAGNNLTQVSKAIANAFAKKKLPAMEPGSMCYMTGKQGFGGDVAPHWPPHLMFFYTNTDPAIWGANLKGSPVVGFADPLIKLTQFVIPVEYYSDGAPASNVSTEHKH
jgi:hypothetical protein